MSATTTTTLRDIMTRNVRALPPHATLRDAAHMMAAEHISSLLVMADGKALGIITESSFLRTLHENVPDDIPLEAIMSHPLITAPADLDLASARDLVEQHGIRHLAISDSSGEVCGIVSDTDFRMHLGTDAFRHLRTLETLMDRNIPSLPPEATFGDALASMVEHGADYLIVAASGAPVGIITEREMMGRLRLRHMVVLAPDGRILGVISQRRLFEQLAFERLESVVIQANQEREKLRLETHLRLALDGAAAGSWEYSHQSSSLVASDGLLSMLGHTRANAPRTKSEWMASIHPEDRHQLDSTVNGENGLKTPFRVTEYRIRHKEGHWLWVEDRSCIVERADDDTPLVTTGVVNDITERQTTRKQIARQNRALRLMSGVSQALVRYNDEEQMLAELCTLAVELGGYPMAWIGEVTHDDEKRILPIASSGLSEAYLSTLIVTWDDAPSGHGPSGRAVRSGIPAIVRNVNDDPSFEPWRTAVQELGFRATIALPLRVDGRITGVLNLYSATVDPFDDEEITLLCNLAAELDLGLSMQRSRQTLAQNEAMLLEAQRQIRSARQELLKTQVEAQLRLAEIERILGEDL